MSQRGSETARLSVSGPLDQAHLPRDFSEPPVRDANNAAAAASSSRRHTQSGAPAVDEKGGASSSSKGTQPQWIPGGLNRKHVLYQRSNLRSNPLFIDQYRLAERQQQQQQQQQQGAAAAGGGGGGAKDGHRAQGLDRMEASSSWPPKPALPAALAAAIQLKMQRDANLVLPASVAEALHLRLMRDADMARKATTHGITTGYAAAAAARAAAAAGHAHAPGASTAGPRTPPAAPSAAASRSPPPTTSASHQQRTQAAPPAHHTHHGGTGLTPRQLQYPQASADRPASLRVAPPPPEILLNKARHTARGPPAPAYTHAPAAPRTGVHHATAPCGAGRSQRSASLHHHVPSNTRSASGAGTTRLHDLSELLDLAECGSDEAPSANFVPDLSLEQLVSQFDSCECATACLVDDATQCDPQSPPVHFREGGHGSGSTAAAAQQYCGMETQTSSSLLAALLMQRRNAATGSSPSHLRSPPHQGGHLPTRDDLSPARPHDGLSPPGRDGLSPSSRDRTWPHHRHHHGADDHLPAAEWQAATHHSPTTHSPATAHHAAAFEDVTPQQGCAAGQPRDGGVASGARRGLEAHTTEDPQHPHPPKIVPSGQSATRLEVIQVDRSGRSSQPHGAELELPFTYTGGLALADVQARAAQQQRWQQQQQWQQPPADGRRCASLTAGCGGTAAHPLSLSRDTLDSPDSDHSRAHVTASRAAAVTPPAADSAWHGASSHQRIGTTRDVPAALAVQQVEQQAGHGARQRDGGPPSVTLLLIPDAADATQPTAHLPWLDALPADAFGSSSSSEQPASRLPGGVAAARSTGGAHHLSVASSEADAPPSPSAAAAALLATHSTPPHDAISATARHAWPSQAAQAASHPRTMPVLVGAPDLAAVQPAPSASPPPLPHVPSAPPGSSMLSRASFAQSAADRSPQPSSAQQNHLSQESREPADMATNAPQTLNSTSGKLFHEPAAGMSPAGRASSSRVLPPADAFNAWMLKRKATLSPQPDTLVTSASASSASPSPQGAAAAAAELLLAARARGAAVASSAAASARHGQAVAHSGKLLANTVVPSRFVDLHMENAATSPLRRAAAASAAAAAASSGHDAGRAALQHRPLPRQTALLPSSSSPAAPLANGFVTAYPQISDLATSSNLSSPTRHAVAAARVSAVPEPLQPGVHSAHQDVSRRSRGRDEAPASPAGPVAPMRTAPLHTQPAPVANGGGPSHGQQADGGSALEASQRRAPRDGPHTYAQHPAASRRLPADAQQRTPTTPNSLTPQLETAPNGVNAHQQDGARNGSALQLGASANGPATQSASPMQTDNRTSGSCLLQHLSPSKSCPASEHDLLAAASPQRVPHTANGLESAFGSDMAQRLSSPQVTMHRAASCISERSEKLSRPSSSSSLLALAQRSSSIAGLPPPTQRSALGPKAAAAADALLWQLLPQSMHPVVAAFGQHVADTSNMDVFSQHVVDVDVPLDHHHRLLSDALLSPASSIPLRHHAPDSARQSPVRRPSRTPSPAPRNAVTCVPAMSWSGRGRGTPASAAAADDAPQCDAVWPDLGQTPVYRPARPRYDSDVMDGDVAPAGHERDMVQGQPASDRLPLPCDSTIAASPEGTDAVSAVSYGCDPLADDVVPAATKAHGAVQVGSVAERRPRRHWWRVGVWLTQMGMIVGAGVAGALLAHGVVGSEAVVAVDVRVAVDRDEV